MCLASNHVAQVSGAHFVAEVIEWTGYAIATGFVLSPAVFAAFNCACLARARMGTQT